MRKWYLLSCALVAGYADGPAAAAQFWYPMDVAIGPDGTLYVADFKNHPVRKITLPGSLR